MDMTQEEARSVLALLGDVGLSPSQRKYVLLVLMGVPVRVVRRRG